MGNTYLAKKWHKDRLKVTESADQHLYRLLIILFNLVCLILAKTRLLNLHIVMCN